MGPNVFPVGVRLFSVGDTTATDLSAEFAFTTANANVTVDLPSTVTIESLPSGAQADVYFNVRIAPLAAAWNTSREFQVTVTGSNFSPAVSSAPREVFVEKPASTGENFTYKANDGDSDSNAATVPIAVSLVNEPPIAIPDFFAVAEDSAAAPLAVLINDADIDGDRPFITAVSPAFNAIVTVTGGGIGLTFQPGPTFNGATSFTYTISDGHGGTATALVNVFVFPVNDAPIAANDSATAVENSAAKPLAVLANDRDIDEGDTLTIATVTQPVGGTVVITGGGTGLTFQPNIGFSGVTTFTYALSDGNGGTDTATVTVTVDALPVAANDTATVTEDAGATAIDVLANDSDPDGDPLTIVAVSRQLSGTVTINAGDLGLTFRPAANFSGLATFTYTISDDKGGTASATVSVTVDPVNDAPSAGAIFYIMLEDSTGTSLDVLPYCFDADGDPVIIIAVTQPARGTVTITGGGTRLAFEPGLNDTSGPSFTYTVSDGRGGTATGTVSGSLFPVSDPPSAVDDSATVLEDSGATVIAVLANDSDPDFMDALIIPAVTQPLGGTVTTNRHQTLTFQPAPNFNGLTTFTYTARDRQGNTASATVSVAVNPVSDPPAAVDDGFFVFEDESSVPLDVLANDSDPDGDALTITAVTQPAGGMVTINEDAKGLTLQPQPNFNSTVTFTYTVSDGYGGSAVATVRLGFFALEDPSHAVDDATTVAQDSGPTTIDVLANDTDADNDPPTIITVTPPSNGLALIATSPAAITFEPNAGFSGTTTFTYTITDGKDQQNTSTAMVTVHVTAVPPTPATTARPGAIRRAARWRSWSAGW
jgi:large repetitive protein